MHEVEYDPLQQGLRLVSDTRQRATPRTSQPTQTNGKTNKHVSQEEVEED
jgi:hypothetical protein